MKKFIAITLLLLLSSCDSLTSRKVKSIVELTPALTVEKEEKVNFTSDLENPFHAEHAAFKSYKIASHPIAAAPVTARGNVYSMDINGNISGFSVADKKTIWTYKFSNKGRNNNYFGGGITHNKGTLLVTNGSRFLAVIDAKTGREIIRKEFPDIIRTKPVLLNDNAVLIKTVSNQLFAYDLSRSALLWQHEGLFEVLSLSHHVPPLVHATTVLVSYNSGQIFGLDASTGKEKWVTTAAIDQTVELPGFEAAAITSPPLIEGDYAYVASATGKVMKVNLDNGGIAWQTTARDIQSMNLIGNHLFVTNNARQLAAINTSTGKVAWAGELDLEKDKRKSKSAVLLMPFATNTNGKKEVNVISNRGEVYSFQLNEDGRFNQVPTVTNITKNVHYYGISCCSGGLYVTTDKSIIFPGEK